LLLPELAIFDMDGLMLDSEPISYISWKGAGKAFGLDVSDEFLLSVTGTNMALCGERFRREYGLDEAGAEAFFRLREQMEDEYAAKNGIPVKKGLFELLDFFGRNGVKIAVATSTSRERAEFRLKITGLSGRAAGMICGDEVTFGKPHPEIFLKCLERWNCPAERAMVLEDSKNGLLAAAGAGIRCVLVPDLQAPDAESAALAYRVAGDLTEVVGLFAP